MSSLELNIIESLPSKPQIGAVIWLHGLGADYNDFAPIIPELNLNFNLRFIFPNAKTRPITINNGYLMRAWYDIKNLTSLNQDIDITGIKASIQEINQIIADLVTEGFDYSQISLVGFSQGGVIAVYSLLSQAHPLAAGIILSSYIPSKELLDLMPSTKNLPIFLAHGIYDPIIPHQCFIEASSILNQLTTKLTAKTYPMEHSVCAIEINDVAKFLTQIYA